MKSDNHNQKKNQDAFKTKMKTIFYNMDIRNNICADCGKKKSMDYASINNGIIICSNCAKEHEKLGYNISFLRSLGDKWDDYLFNYIKAGGNSRFIQFCKDYKVDKRNNNIIQKYKSKGLVYYRDIIRSEVLGYEPPDNININKACEEEPEIPDNYPEFKKYSFVKHVDKNYLDKNFYKKKEEAIEDKGFFEMIGGIWGSVKKKVGDEAGDLMKKISEINYNEIKEKGSSMLGYFFGQDNKNNTSDINEEKNLNEEEGKNNGNSFEKIFGNEVARFKKEDKSEKKEKEENFQKERNNLENKKENYNEVKNQKEEIKVFQISKEIKIEENERGEKYKKQLNTIIKEKNIDKMKYIEKKNINEIELSNENTNKIETIENIIGKEQKKNESENENINNENNYKEIIYQIENEENKDIKKNKNNNTGKNEKTEVAKEKNKEDIEEILKDDNFSDSNSKMNKDEKDELEKILQE